MSGNGGFKQRQTALHNKVNQRRKKAQANIARIRNQFEEKGQTWDPVNDSSQLAALNHHGRRFVLRARKP